MTSDYEYMRQKYASLEVQYFALVKAIADGLTMQAPFEIALLGIKP